MPELPAQPVAVALTPTRALAFALFLGEGLTFFGEGGTQRALR